MYCPKCGSVLYPDDAKYITAVGVCGSCVQFDKPDGVYRRAWAEANIVRKHRKGQDYAIFRYGHNGNEYLTETGSTPLEAQAKRFTRKQAQANCLKWNKSSPTRYWFYMKVEDTA